MKKTPLIHHLVILAFVVNMLTPFTRVSQAGELVLPQPGAMVRLSPEFTPSQLTAISIHPVPSSF